MQAYIVARTLVWCGVKHYIDNNQAAFDWLRQTAPLCWQVLVPVNFTEIELEESVDKLFGSHIGITMDDVRKDFLCRLRSISIYVNGLIVLSLWKSLKSGETIFGWKNS